MKLKIVLLVIVVYIGTLVINLPAAVVVSWLPQNAVKIEGPAGTIWKGKADKVIVDRNLSFNKVEWDTQLLALFTLSLEADVAFDNGPSMSGKGLVKYGLSGASASNVFMDISADKLVSLLPMRLPVEMTGDFSAVIKHISQGEPYCSELDGSIVWHNAVISSQIGLVDLASPNVDLSCNNGAISALAVQDSEQIKSTFDVQLKEGGLYQLNGEIIGKDQLPSNIAQSLTWIGPKNAQGATTLSFSGKL